MLRSVALLNFGTRRARRSLSVYDGARTPASPGRPYALESSGSVKAGSNGGPSAPRSREIRRCMQTAHTYGVRAYCGLLTMHGTEFGQYIHITFTP